MSCTLWVVPHSVTWDRLNLKMKFVKKIVIGCLIANILYALSKGVSELIIIKFPWFKLTSLRYSETKELEKHKFLGIPASMGEMIFGATHGRYMPVKWKLFYWIPKNILLGVSPLQIEFQTEREGLQSFYLECNYIKLPYSKLSSMYQDESG